MLAQEHATQATHDAAQAAAHGGAHAARRDSTPARRSSSTSRTASLDHPLIHLPTIVGIDFSVTKHVFMLWLVAAFVFVVVTTRRPPLPEGAGRCRPAS